MKINSNFKDYYDGVVAQHRDPHIHWNRKTEIVNAPLSKLGPLSKIGRDYRVSSDRYRPHEDESNLELNVIGFCGKFYPILLVVTPGSTVEYVYHIEDILEYIKYGWIATTSHGYSAKAQALDQANTLKEIAEYRNDELFIETNSPIIYFEAKNKNISPFPFVKNICLTDVKFYKVKNAWEAMEELTMFFSSILTRPDNIPEPDNKTKIKAAGFDLKASFRKAPTKNK